MLGPVILRRARGYAPGAVARRPVLAVGADLKNTVTLVMGGEAFVSQHIGDLRHYEAQRAFRETIQDLLAIYEVEEDGRTHGSGSSSKLSPHTRVLASPAWCPRRAPTRDAKAFRADTPALIVPSMGPLSDRYQARRKTRPEIRITRICTDDWRHPPVKRQAFGGNPFRTERSRHGTW